MERETHEPSREEVAAPARPATVAPTAADRVTQLQRTIGNRRTTRVLAREPEVEKETKSSTRISLGEAGEIDLLSYSLGAHYQEGGAGSHRGKMGVTEASFSSYQGDHSQKLMKMVMEGTPVTAHLVMRKQEKVYLEVTFSKAMVTSFQVGGQGGDTKPVESWSINFESVEYKQP